MTFALQRHATVTFATLLICSISFLPHSSGLVCNTCGSGRCQVSETIATCTATRGGFCYSSIHADISGDHWNMLKGCTAENSIICKTPDTDMHKVKCCNDTDRCNEDLIELPSIKCNCVNGICDKGDSAHCTLKSNKFSCFTQLYRKRGHLTYNKGCMKNCKDTQTDHEIRICCRSNKCNNHSTEEWPSSEPHTEVPSAPPTTTNSNAGDFLTATTTAAVTTTITTTAKPEHTTATEQPSISTTSPQQPVKIKCHCSLCNTPWTCEATVGCLLASIKSRTGLQHITSCVNQHSSCNNESTVYTQNPTVMCCNSYDFCNAPPKSSQGLPCDDEDSEQSGCYSIDHVTPSMVSASSTTASTTTTTTSISTSSSTNDVTTGSIRVMPTSSNEATLSEEIIAEEFEEELNNNKN